MHNSGRATGVELDREYPNKLKDLVVYCRASEAVGAPRRHNDQEGTIGCAEFSTVDSQLRQSSVYVRYRRRLLQCRRFFVNCEATHLLQNPTQYYIRVHREIFSGVFFLTHFRILRFKFSEQVFSSVRRHYSLNNTHGRKDQPTIEKFVWERGRHINILLNALGSRKGV